MDYFISHPEIYTAITLDEDSLVYGNIDLSVPLNCKLIDIVTTYIRKTVRF